MEKKIKFSDNPAVAKGIYAGIIALLCITAIVIGIIAAAGKKDNNNGVIQNPPVDDGGENNGDGENNGSGSENSTVTYISPVSGRVIKNHSTDAPVYSTTLEEWRIHTGIDISTEEGADVFAAADGSVSSVYSHPLLGKTVEITHEDGVTTVYSNLSSDGLPAVGASVRCGEKIGCVGDSAITEIADEAHLHFEVKVNGKSADPLEYISEEAKKTSLGIIDESAA